MSGPLTCAAVEGCRAIPAMVVVERDGIARCLTHTQDVTRAKRRDARNRAGGYRRLRSWPKDERLPPFPRSLDALPRWAARLAACVLRGDVDPRLVAEARNLAQLAVISPRAILAQERIGEALARLEHGGPAVAVLAHLTAGLADETRRRPLPGRKVLTLPAPDGEAAS